MQIITIIAGIWYYGGTEFRSNLDELKFSSTSRRTESVTVHSIHKQARLWHDSADKLLMLFSVCTCVENSFRLVEERGKEEEVQIC